MRNRTETAYIVYPPKYTPGAGYRNYRNKQKALRAALQMGDGAEIYREIGIRKNEVVFYRIESGWEVSRGDIICAGTKESNP